MKNSVKKILIVVVVIAIIAILAVIGVFIFAKNKTPITAEEFKTRMEAKGYIVGDATYQFEEYDEQIKKVYIATNEDYTYQIEFYEISDIDNAKSFFNLNKQNFENMKGNTSSQSNVNLKNYSKYTLSTNGKYKVLSRVENTVIYLNVDDGYRDTIKDILKDIGY